MLRADWRIDKYALHQSRRANDRFDGSHKKDASGKEIRLAVPDSDSGIYLRGSSKAQVNIGAGRLAPARCTAIAPISGAVSAAVRAGVTPKRNADRDIGAWNTFEITMRGNRLTVVLNGEEVLSQAELPGVAPRGPIALQHHGEKKNGVWTAPPSLVQFRNIAIKER